MTLHASTCLSYQDVPWTRVVHPHQTSLVRPVFPVTRQVRRKRTRVFRSVGARGGNERRRARASGRAVAQNWGARAPRVGLGRDKGGLGERQGWAWGRDKGGLGGETRWAWGRQGGHGDRQGRVRKTKGELREKVNSRDTQTHRWPPDGQAAHPGQRCDPAGPAAVTEIPGPIRWDTASWSPL